MKLCFLMLFTLKTQSFIYPKVSSTKLGPDETLGAGLPDQIFSKRTHFQKMNASSEDLSASTQNVCVHGRNSSALAGWCLACCLLVLGWIVLWLLWCLAGSALLLVGWLVSLLSDLLLVCCIWCSLQCSRQATGNRQQATEPVSK